MGRRTWTGADTPAVAATRWSTRSSTASRSTTSRTRARNSGGRPIRFLSRRRAMVDGLTIIVQRSPATAPAMRDAVTVGEPDHGRRLRLRLQPCLQGAALEAWSRARVPEPLLAPTPGPVVHVPTDRAVRVAEPRYDFGGGEPLGGPAVRLRGAVAGRRQPRR